jgi:hypothetical protein
MLRAAAKTYSKAYGPAELDTINPFDAISWMTPVLSATNLTRASWTWLVEFRKTSAKFQRIIVARVAERTLFINMGTRKLIETQITCKISNVPIIGIATNPETWRTPPPASEDNSNDPQL